MKPHIEMLFNEDHIILETPLSYLMLFNRSDTPFENSMIINKIL